MSEEQRRQLQQQLWNIANTLRGKMNADEFRDYILGFIFYKYLSEKIERFADAQLKQENLKYSELKDDGKMGTEYIKALQDAALDELGYFLKPEELFHAIAMKGSNQVDSGNTGDSHNFILGDLAKILKNIEQSTLGTDSEDDFENLFEDLDLDSSKLGKTTKEKNDLIAKVLVHLDAVDFDLANANADVLGDAYEYLIGEFASGAGKKAGEFYTPQPVSTLLAKLVTANNKNLRYAYDPTCGSGSLLLRVKREATQVGKIYGQELNRTTFNLARMNMILHDVHFSDFDIKQEDTLEKPQHLGLKFDAIVANPPFSAHWSSNPLFMNDDRFGIYGKLAPKTKADLAFVQHIISHLSEEGTAAIVLPHGVLFRGAAEGHIRQYMIEELNCIDAVIGLPSNIFYGTGIPTCILVLKKCRKNPNDVLFIDASKHFEKVKKNHVMREDHIAKIINAYKNRTNEKGYSNVVKIDSLRNNNWNLNISRYVDSIKTTDPVNLDLVANHLIELDEKIISLDKKITNFCNDLGISSPYKKGVIQKIFSQNIRFKDSDGNEYPSWQKILLKEVIKKFIVPMRDKPKSLVGPIPWCRIEDFDGKYLSSSKSGQGVDSATISSMNLKLYPINTLLVSCSANLGICAIVKTELVTNQTFIGLVPNEQLINIEFLYYLMSLSAPRLNALSSGTTISYLSREQFENFDVLVPCIEEQTKIAEFLSNIDDKISIIQKQLELTKQYKRGLLQQMFV